MDSPRMFSMHPITVWVCCSTSVDSSVGRDGEIVSSTLTASTITADLVYLPLVQQGMVWFQATEPWTPPPAWCAAPVEPSAQQNAPACIHRDRSHLKEIGYIGQKQYLKLYTEANLLPVKTQKHTSTGCLGPWSHPPLPPALVMCSMSRVLAVVRSVVPMHNQPLSLSLSHKLLY